MKELLTYGLIAAGGFLLYRRFMQQPESDSAVQPGPGADSPPAATPPAAQPRTVALVTMELLKAAAADPARAAAAGNHKMTADQWNWYRAEATGIPQAFDLFPPDDRGYLMTATEYHERRRQANLAGVAA